MPAQQMRTSAQENILSAFEYLLYLDRLRAKPVFRLSDHKLPYFHEDQFLGLPGIEVNLLEGDAEIWLRIRRLQAHPPPEPPDIVLPWINLPNDPAKGPTLEEAIVVTSPATKGSEDDPPEQVELHLDDAPEVREAFKRYQTTQWQTWSDSEKPRRRTIQLYDRFFSLQQEAETGSSDDAIEIACGVGMALWKLSGEGQEIAYPLISKTVEIHIDETTLSLNVIPTERDPAVHIDAFLALDIAADEVETRAKKEFAAAQSTFSPFDRATFEGVLRFAAAHLDGHGMYWPDAAGDRLDRSMPSTRDHLIVTDTWTLFARKRGSSFIAADIERLKSSVLEGTPVEGAPALVVTAPPDKPVTRQRIRYRGISTSGFGNDGEAGNSPEEDLYFPKPFNDEQISIVDRAEQSDGVVVQGPPGTGKTHTIANIVCHYLALGRRVLVTAQHEAPLSVLRDQIPETLRPLCISLLTSEREGLKQLEQSVRKIASEISQLDVRELDREINAGTQRLDSLHQELARLEHDLREIGTKQTSEVPFLQAATKPEALAKTVVAQEVYHDWFPDAFHGESPPVPQFTDDDIQALGKARKNLREDIVYVERNLPRADRLPVPEDIVRLHDDLTHYHELNQSVVEGTDIPPLRHYNVEALKSAEALRQRADEIHALLRMVRLPWQKRVRELLAAHSTDEMTALIAQHLKDWITAVLQAETQRQAFLIEAIELPIGAEGNIALFKAIERASVGKRPFGLLGGDKAAKALFEQIRIRNEPPAKREQWQRIVDYLNFARQAHGLRAQWNQLRMEFDGPEVVDGPAAVVAKQLFDAARPLAGAWKLDEQLAHPFIEQARQLFGSGFQFELLAEDLTELDRLIRSVAAHLQHSRLKSALNEKNEMRDALTQCGGPIVDRLEIFVNESLGTAGLSAEVIHATYLEILTELARLTKLQSDLDTVARVTHLISESGAPNWAAHLRKPLLVQTDAWLPLTWRAAWEWAQAKGYLDTIDSRSALQRLARQRRQTEEDLNKANLRLVELRTWRQLKSNMTGSISAALQSYLTAITRIGQGTGIRSARYRQDARKAMRSAYGAVPCWIMPHWRVSEALPPEFGLFDLVIIDEASQSDAWALPAIARAKKLLVVGDDKQVSPSDVGMAEADIRMLRRRFLEKLPYGGHLLPGSSIYDLASTMFSLDIIRLREHFRCVEPIIAFSNRNFYDNEIRPLRVPKPSERLDPPLIDVYVKGGYRLDRKKINKPEARYIVEEIRQIIETPALTGRSIGVVSLLGGDQAKYIQEALIQELGEEAILNHGIRCGDAMHFQGKEADIVFISMVAAGAIRADSGRMYEQRYNVACSRARDRLYVVHSFTRDEVQDNDLRARLLDHLSNPLGIDQHAIDDLRGLCESDFERDVFDELINRGYRVVPQVRAGSYRIDMVVEGGNDRRLAIECDGDQYHGVDQWMYDIGRQRTLERMGWRFWRCWGSSWTADRQACIDDLLETLSERGIQPIGMQEYVHQGLVERQVIEPESVSVTPPAAVAETMSAEPFATITETGAFQPNVAVSAPPIRRAVSIGDTVTYAAMDAPESTLRITIISGESDPGSGTTNEHTPLAEALLGTEIGDEVDAYLPSGMKTFQILAIDGADIPPSE